MPLKHPAAINLCHWCKCPSTPGAIQLTCPQGSRAVLEFGKVSFRPFFVPPVGMPNEHVTCIQAGLLLFVLNSMRISEITNDEIIHLIGADPAIAAGPFKSQEEKNDALRRMSEENESAVADFRGLQVRCVFVYFHTLSLNAGSSGGCFARSSTI
jgi:hypothetical protein